MASEGDLGLGIMYAVGYVVGVPLLSGAIGVASAPRGKRLQRAVIGAALGVAGLWLRGTVLPCFSGQLGYTSNALCLQDRIGRGLWQL
jgi:hypothetical protein